MLTPDQASNSHKVKKHQFNSIVYTPSPDFKHASKTAVNFHLTPLAHPTGGFPDDTNDQNCSITPLLNPSGLPQRQQLTLYNHSQLTCPPSAAAHAKNISVDYVHKSKSSATPHVKEFLNKELKKTKFNVPKIQMPPIIANHNKPLSLNDKQMFGCYIQQVQEISMTRNKGNHDSNVANTERKGKASKQKHKVVAKGPSLENLVYTPARNEFLNGLAVNSPEAHMQENYLNKSKSTNTRKIQQIHHLNGDALDLDTELWDGQHRHQQRTEQYVQQKQILQKLYVKNEMKKAPSIKTAQKEHHNKKSKSPSHRKKHGNEAQSQATHKHLSNTQLIPTVEQVKKDKNRVLSEARHNADEKVIHLTKLQDNCNNLSDFLSKAGVIGHTVNVDQITDSKQAAKQILQMNRTFKTGQKLEKIKRDSILSSENGTYASGFYKETEQNKKLKPLKPTELLQAIREHQRAINSPSGLNPLRGSFDKPQLRQTEFVDKKTHQLEMMDSAMRNQFNRTQEMCIDGHDYANKRPDITTPVQKEKTRMVFSLPNMDGGDNSKPPSGLAVGTETNSLNESTEKSIQLYNMSMMQLKTAMRVMPDVRPIEIHNRHNTSSKSGAGGSSESRTRMFMGQENIKSIFSKPPLMSPSRLTNRKYGSREPTPRHDHAMRNDIGEIDQRSASEGAFNVEGSDNQSSKHDQPQSPDNCMRIDEGASIDHEGTNEIEKKAVKDKKFSQDPVSRNLIKFSEDQKPSKDAHVEKVTTKNSKSNAVAAKASSLPADSMVSARLSNGKESEENINSGEQSLKSSRKNSKPGPERFTNQLYRNSLKAQNPYHKHKSHLKKQQKEKEKKQQLELQGPDQSMVQSPTSKAKTARFFASTSTSLFAEQRQSKPKLLSTSPSNGIDQSGRRYQQLMAQSFIPELTVLEKRISKLNKMPDQFNRMMLKKQGSNDTGVMSILKVSDEKFHMKQSNGYLIPIPIGVDSTQGQLNHMSKTQTDQSIKNKISFAETSSSAFANPFGKGSKKRVNFDLPQIQKLVANESDGQRQETQITDQMNSETQDQATATNSSSMPQRSRSLVDPGND